MKKLFFLPLMLLFMISCEKESLDSNNNALSEQTESDTLSRAEINAQVYATLEETGDFNWNDASDQMIWSALIHGDHILTVGYAEANDVETKSTDAISVKNQIVNSVFASESKGQKLKSASDIFIDEDEDLIILDLLVKNLETVKEIRKMQNIRYIEPAGYNLTDYSNDVDLKSSGIFGCDNTSVTLNSGDYTIVSPGCKVPWNFYKHNITSAWSYSTGSGITVGLIDTGVSSSQSLLGSNFNDGYSSGRSIKKYGVYVDSFWPWVTKTDGYNDKCGHGTSMACALSAPRNNNYLPVGVAYNCNLIAYRATSDVILDGYHEQKGVAKALTNLGNTSSVKIISMSLGHVITVNRIKDAVKYAYSKGKLIFSAGGTSTWFTNNVVEVIFPANMSETVAVTGITDSQTYTQCEVCHKGSKIDFTVIMQRSSNADRVTPVTGYYENTTRYSGGSSVSTAMTAGIAALTWAKYPTWSRSQILAKLKQSAEFYPTRNSNYGYGCIDALKAVR